MMKFKIFMMRFAQQKKRSAGIHNQNLQNLFLTNLFFLVLVFIAGDRKNRKIEEWKNANHKSTGHHLESFVPGGINVETSHMPW